MGVRGGVVVEVGMVVWAGVRAHLLSTCVMYFGSISLAWLLLGVVRARMVAHLLSTSPMYSGAIPISIAWGVEESFGCC